LDLEAISDLPAKADAMALAEDGWTPAWNVAILPANCTLGVSDVPMGQTVIFADGSS